jgi:beta-N-acetylhexosaminidase
MIAAPANHWCISRQIGLSFSLLKRFAAFLLSAVAFAAKPAPKPKPPPLTTDQRSAQSMLKSLSLSDRVAQLVLGVAYADPISTKSREYQKWTHWVRDLHIGGLIINNTVQNGQVRPAEAYAMAVLLNRIQKLAKIPLLVGGDFERGASMRVGDSVKFPFNMAYGAADDVEASRFEGLQAAKEARALGVHWIFAPDADVNSNPANPIINIRAYGEDPALVSRHVAAFIDGAHSDPNNMVLVTAKHFPGHGDTSEDSHNTLALLDKDREHMDAVELRPFEAAIAHGADAIMTAHMAVPAIDPDGVPATVSPKVLTGLLRDELHFRNLIVTDAMDNMRGLTDHFKGGEAAIRALLAGADVLLMPPNPETAIRAVVAAVESGRISRQRIDESALRVLAAKVRVGLTNKKKLVDVEALGDVLESPEAIESAQRISDRAITLVRNEGHVVPLAAPKQTCVVIAAVRRRATTTGQRFLQEFQHRASTARIMVADSNLPEAALESAVSDMRTCSAVVVAAFADISDGGSLLPGSLGPFVEKLTNSPTPVAFVSVGSNPYLLTQFPKVAAYLATFSLTPPSETAAVKALFGEIPITGHLPVSIPGFAAVGEGIQLSARTR